jgi:hypothetical protein
VPADSVEDPWLIRAARVAERRFRSELERSAPFMAPRVAIWLDEMFDGASLGQAFSRRSAFPVLALPWWVEDAFATPDAPRQRTLASSSMAGYLHIRLIDNVMDADRPGDRRLLPALTYLSTAFVRPYRTWFPRTHPFWDDFERFWVGAADVTMQDAHLTTVDIETFSRISARKTIAAMIPVAAICYLHHRADRIHAWEGLLTSFGRWHQLLNDLRSWARDLESGASTYLLSEAERRRRPDEPVAVWLLRDGVGWTLALLEEWMTELMAEARNLDSPRLSAYLADRHHTTTEGAEAAQAGTATALQLVEAVRSSHPAGLRGSTQR